MAVPSRAFNTRQQVQRKLHLVTRTAAPQAASTVVAPPQAPITLTDAALTQLKKLKADNKNPDVLLLRVGVKQGGCSGLSYVMDFEDKTKVTADDTVVGYDGGSLELAIDPKSLLYLFGMNLDYSTELIGGGFKFLNPNATDSCGCGKSFGV
eukprot:CAMPEP_0202865648 /NCGR_PEP_ID=MMETSP1391-20130828/6277_1 /ASSEMBLY_ACC=CAM_ASM_000867 /TAXON_ID=1034604 /ORGANISM="Chlamydomonas leiostraca, Strain SAG 11-49" /LENGTH=151 /DNA_ID=CAMNT_0049545511 /DNA_START=73 /DNA_END=528 /DNA_ORIENTATION=+